MKKKKQIFLTCIISILIFVIIFYFLSQFAKEKTYKVFLLKQDLAAGNPLEQSMISIIEIPQSSVLPQSCKKFDEFLGKNIVNDMKAGELLSINDIQVEENGIKYPQLSEGMVLYTLTVDPDDVNGWWIAKGNDVVLLIYNPIIEKESFVNSSMQEAMIVLENSIQTIDSVKIIRIMDEKGKEVLPDGNEPKIICLEVTKEQAEILFKAENGKKIKLIAKNINS